MTYKRLKDGGGELQVMPLQGAVKKVFEDLMLDKVLPTYHG